MIIRRQLYSQNKLPAQKVYDNGMEFKPIYKKAPEPSTTSTSIMGDVDDLLKPIHRPTNNEEEQQNQFSKERTERNLWRNEEVMEMLYTMQQVKALEKLNDKTVKSENVFKDVEVVMHRNGFVKKSHVQIWTKWKFLKSTYMTSKRNGVIPRIVPPKIYDMIHQMITGLNQSLADSCSSVDGDSSSVSGMVISGVEGGLTNGEDEDSFGMAHPIFGYRLGMVKSEPQDTGYEPINNANFEKDPLEEELSPVKSVKGIKGGHNNHDTNINKEMPPVEKVLEVPHRGRGRPPKNPPTVTSTHNNTPSPATMPPLRVAPFAKTINTLNSNAANRPPPPLTMPPSTRIRVTNFSNSKTADSEKFSQPKLTPKPTHKQHSPPPVQSVRISKELTAQSRASSTPSPSYPKMKQIPMRKTPYSLRPDRAIPDLDASLSPPPPAIEKALNKKSEEVPSTKHLTMQSSTNNLQNIPNRKRRTDWQEPAASSKQIKYNKITDEETNDSKSYNIEYDKNYGKVLQHVIIDLSSSLRKMQTDMMRDFFNKQNELLEREHKFQMQQDHMIMQAFQEQTQEIMHSVKQLVGSIKTNQNYRYNYRAKNTKHTKCYRSGPGRIQEMHTQEQMDEMESAQMENNNSNEEDNELRNEIQGQVQEQEEIYTDDEQQQDQMEERDESDQDEILNHTNEEENDDNDQHEDEDQSQLADTQNESDASA